MSSPHIADLPEGGYRHEHVNKSLGDNMKSCSFWVNVYAHGVGGQTYPTRERAAECVGTAGVTVGVNLHRLDETDGPMHVHIPYKSPPNGPISWNEAKNEGQRSEDMVAMARHPPGNPIVGAVGMGQAIGRDWARQEASREQFESASLKIREAAASQRKAVLREFLEPLVERMRWPPRNIDHAPAYELIGAELALVNAALEAYLDLPVKP